MKNIFDLTSTTSNQKRIKHFASYFLLSFFVLMLLFPTISLAEKKNSDWSGTWDTRWRDGGASLVLTQEGNTVSGIYPLYNGRIEATVQGRTLKGNWFQEDRSGTFEFVQSRDGQSFTGRFSTGEWWTGIRLDMDRDLGITIDQSSPMTVLRSYLMITNLSGSDNMELMGLAAELLHPKEALIEGADRIEYVRRLTEVLDKITVRLWNLPQQEEGNVATYRLRQAGTDEYFDIEFMRINNKWFISPPSIPELKTIRDDMREARGLAPGTITDYNNLLHPRATMRSFISNSLRNVGDSNAKIRATLNLSNIADVARNRESAILAGYLKMVIDRVGYVIHQEIPDDPDSRTPYAHFEHPIGNIVIAPVETEAGVVWQFTPETLSTIRALYAAMDDFPIAEGLAETPPVDVHFAIRNFVRGSAPGLLMPLGILERWQWVGMGLGFVFAILLALIFSWIGIRVSTKTGLHKAEADSAQHLLTVWALRGLASGAVLLISIHYMGIPDEFSWLIVGLSWILVVFGSFMIAWRLIGWISRRHAKNQSVDGHNLVLLSLATGMARIILLLGSIFLLAHLLSLPLNGVLAGLGIGGLAVALAAQPTLQNLLAGFTIYADRPVSVGDFCRFGDKTATVEYIGLRSTRLRTLDRTLISVPNAQFLDMQLENYALRDRRLLKTELQLRYETTPDQMRYVLAELRKLMIAHPMVLPEPKRIRFTGFGSHSLNIEIFVYILRPDIDGFTAIKEDLMLRIMNIIHDAGAQFAFPSMVHYRAEDQKADPEKTTQAEAAVAKWRELEELPFPEFEWETIEKLSDTLDWPPEGSIEQKKLKAQETNKKQETEEKKSKT